MPSTRLTARRLFSLTGIVPLGAFLVLHVVVNARAVRGEDAFDAAVSAMHRVPGLRWLEIVFVLLPLFLHAAIGVWLVANGASVAEPSPYPRPLLLTMRGTGMVALGFLVWHLPEVKAISPGPRLEGGELLAILQMHLSSTWHGIPLSGLLYLFGAAAVTLHFVAGAWGFAARMPRAADPRTRRWLGWAAGALGVTLFAFFADVAVLHATGARLFGARAAPPPSHEPCPIPDSSAR
jgi:succinate dehydrogenase / fumarate reductase cytochrome b subunit